MNILKITIKELRKKELKSSSKSAEKFLCVGKKQSSLLFSPKKTNFDTISNKEIRRVEYLINTRPRKRLNGLTPAEFFEKETGVKLF